MSLNLANIALGFDGYAIFFIYGLAGVYCDYGYQLLYLNFRGNLGGSGFFYLWNAKNIALFFLFDRYIMY